LADPASRNATNAIAAQPHNDQNYLDGQMDEIRMYDRALSDSEISSLTDPGSGPSSGLIAHYPLDSKEPTDKSGNGNDPTKNGDIITVADIGLGSNWVLSLDTSSTFEPTWNGVHNFAAETDFTAPLHVYDNQDVAFGTAKDFAIAHDSSSNELVVSDSNDVELIRQPKGDTTQFIQGIDAGSIKAPTDSYAQVINTAVTDLVSSGDTVGHTLAVNNQTGLSVEAEAGGSGGIASGSLHINVDGNDIRDSGTTIYDGSGGNIATSAIAYDTGDFVNTGPDLAIKSNSISEDKIDNNMSPTWSSEHEFSSGIDVSGGNIEQSGTSFFSDVVATGTTTLPASVSTGIISGRPQLYVGVGVQALQSADARVDYDVMWDHDDGSGGGYYVVFYENGTNGNPEIDYTIVRMD